MIVLFLPFQSFITFPTLVTLSRTSRRMLKRRGQKALSFLLSENAFNVALLGVMLSCKFVLWITLLLG